MNRVCLSGKDVAALLGGEQIAVAGTEFTYDGLGLRDIKKALEALERRLEDDRSRRRGAVAA